MICAITLSIPVFGASAQDVEPSEDHPLLSRFPGSVIVQYDQKNYDEAVWCSDYRCQTTERVEGKVTRITYSIGEDHSTLELIRSYEQALARAAFEPVFDCTGQSSIDACPTPSHYLDLPGEDPLEGGERFFNDDRRLSVLRKGGTYVSIYAYRGDEATRMRVRVIEGKELEETIVVDAATISSTIEASGSIALYGIHFDVDDATLRPESRAVLVEIAGYLSAAPEARLLVVGHTDNTGDLDHNLELSERRAQAVVDTLVSVHGVDSLRLLARGAGPIAPVASNESDTGRAQNRRVQLVLRQ
jgi:outer membrane protein OmpA-like peptidoglycan-associated protein